MTDFDRDRTRQLFEVMTQGFDGGHFTPSVDDMPVVLMEDVPVALDSFGGEDLRTMLLRTQANAKSLLHRMGPVSKFAEARFITKRLAIDLQNYEAGDAVGKLLAVCDPNIYWYNDPDDVNAAGRHVGDLLADEEIAFGTIEGVSYGPYRAIKNSTLRKHRETGAKLSTVNREGGMLVLSDVVVCESDGIGHVDRRYPEIFVPIHRKMFRWFLVHAQM